MFIPVTQYESKQIILKILELYRNDNQRGWYMKPDGSYEKKQVEHNQNIIDVQYELEKYFKLYTMAVTKKKTVIEKIKSVFSK